MARAAGWIGLLGLLGCGPGAPVVAPPTSSELTLFHTSDLHSHLFPTAYVPTALDQARGLGEEGVTALVGGLARLGGLLEIERERAARHLYLDSGDLWQGARAYAEFEGEAELVGMAALGVDAAVVGNHDLDDGLEHFAEMHERLGAFPVLATNYVARSSTSLAPWLVLDAGGVRVGLVGVANVESVPALERGSSELTVVPASERAAVQDALEVLGSQADVLVALTHQGIDADRALVRETEGLDLVLGGHQHLTLDEPVVEHDRGGRPVLIAHSGAHGRYLGKLRVVLSAQASAGPGLEVAEHEFSLLPVTEGLPDQGEVAAALASYEQALKPSDQALGYAEAPLPRGGAGGGDSPLGNLAADAALSAAPTDLAMLTSSSLRGDLDAGLVGVEALYRVLPFSDPLLRVYMSGRDLDALFERLAERARRYGCETPVQIAGAALRFSCAGDTTRAGLFVVRTGGGCATDAECEEGACAPVASGVSRQCLGRPAPDQLYALTTTAFLLGDYGEAARPADLVSETLRGAVEHFIASGAPCFEALPCLSSLSEGRIALE